ncbi:MAG: PKD domain-containing protein, partial [Victivallales bacterium]
IASYAWNFGDSTTGTGVSPTHAYAAAGTYTVSLTVTDNRGGKSTASTTCAITPPSLNNAPVVKTRSVTNISRTSATGRGEITSLGSTNPTAYGVVWNKTGSPKIGDRISKFTNKGTTKKTDSFSSTMSGLSSNTKYYVRAYATNKSGTSYGAEVSFTTSRRPGDNDNDDDDDRYSSRTRASSSVSAESSSQPYVVTALVPVDVQLTLKPGWNLLSLPFATDPDTTPESVLVDANGKTVFSGMLWSSEAASSDDDNNAQIKGSIPAGKGFWAYNPTAKTISTVLISGTPPADNPSLEVGWNLIGVSRSMSASEIDASKSITDVREWNPATRKYISLSSETILIPGIGYWVECSD